MPSSDGRYRKWTKDDWYCLSMSISFFLNDTATTEIYTLPLHDALPIYENTKQAVLFDAPDHTAERLLKETARRDRKSTRLNSSHANISYAVFCLKKKINYPLLLSESAESCMR